MITQAKKLPHAETLVGEGGQSFNPLKSQFQRKPLNMEHTPPTIRGRQDSICPHTNFSEMEVPAASLISDFQPSAFVDLIECNE